MRWRSGIRFEVHQANLEAASSVFADMFELASNDSSGETPCLELKETDGRDARGPPPLHLPSLRSGRLPQLSPRLDLGAGLRQVLGLAGDRGAPKLLDGGFLLPAKFAGADDVRQELHFRGEGAHGRLHLCVPLWF